MDLKAIERAFEQLGARLVHEPTRPIATHLQDDGILVGIHEDIRLTNETQAGWWQKVGAVLRDPRYSDVGRQGEIKKIATKALGEVTVLKARMDSLMEAKRHLQGLIDYRPRRAERDSDPQLTYLRAREIRDRGGLASGTQQERDIAFLKAAESGNVEVMRALTIGVPGGSLVSDPMVQRGIEVYGRQIDLEAVEMLEKLEVRRDRLQGLMDHVARALLTMGLDPAEIKTALGLETDGLDHVA